MRPSLTPMVLNGSHGEGGGALLRTALAVAALVQQPVRIHNIRGATRKPGISSEDLTFIRAIEASCFAELVGDSLGSTDLTMVPRRAARAINMRLDVREHEKGNVPGNALILAESLLPVLARAGAYSKLIIHGETYNPNTLTYEAFERVTLAAHRRQGLYAYSTQPLAGFGYAGYGEVGLEIEPSVLAPLDWSRRGKLKGLYAAVTTAELQPTVAERGLQHLAAQFESVGLSAEVEHVQVASRGPGAFVTIWGEYENGYGCSTAMGARGVRMERVVEQAFEPFHAWLRSDATTDPNLADQLLLPAALVDGATVYTTSRITQRLVTMAWVIKQFLPIHITILGREGEPGTVKISP